MIVRAFFLGALSALLLLAGLIPARMAAQGNPNLRLVAAQTVTGSRGVKLPDLAVAKRTVALSGGVVDRYAATWLKADVDTAFSNTPIELGAVRGQPDYTNTAVAARSDGTLTYAWSENAISGPIQVRQRAANGALSGVFTVNSGAQYFFVDIVTAENGTTIVAWRDTSNYRLAYSTGGNLSQWSGSIAFAPASGGRPILAAGPNSEIWVTFYTPTGDIRAGVWNGSGFSLETVAATSAYEADPTVTILPDGRPVVAWRRVDGGMRFATRQSGGGWAQTTVTDTATEGLAAVAADEGGNLSFAWTPKTGGIFAAYLSAQNTPSGPIQLAAGGEGFFNPFITSNLSDRSSIHVAVENFTGGLQISAYVLLADGVGGAISAQPVIEGGAALSNKSSSVQVTFGNVQGNPTQVRWRWNEPPTDVNTPWSSAAAYQSTLTIPVPFSVNTQDCVPEVLYTQVRDSSQRTETTPKQASITLDTVVNASVQAINPYSRSAAAALASSGLALPQDIVSSGGASDGDAGYTRIPFFYLDISGGADCAGLASYRTGATGASLGATGGISNDRFSAILLLPNGLSLPDGSAPIVVQVTDALGNVRTDNLSIVLDRVKPTLTSGSLAAVTPGSASSLLTSLQLSNVTVTDTGYPDDYWGVWIANSRSLITDTLTNTSLNWYPVAIPVAGRTLSPTVTNWSLASGLTSSQLTAGTYYVYVRLLDGAGNFSDQVMTSTVTLSTAPTRPQVMLPLVQR